MRCAISLVWLAAGQLLAQSTCVTFPANFVPFSSISYVTAANGAGDHLVVGVPAAGFQAAIANLPLPAFTNQTFCDSQVQLAPRCFRPKQRHSAANAWLRQAGPLSVNTARK